MHGKSATLTATSCKPSIYIYIYALCHCGVLRSTQTCSSSNLCPLSFNNLVHCHGDLRLGIMHVDPRQPQQNKCSRKLLSLNIYMEVYYRTNAFMVFIVDWVVLCFKIVSFDMLYSYVIKFRS